MDMRIKKIIFCGTIFLSLLSGVFAKDITISVGAGQNWKQKMNPQFAVWLEDSNGNFMRTLYVTKKTAKESWIFAPKMGRPESLPVWYFASGKNTAEFDAVTGATPKGGKIFDVSLEDGKDYVIKAEFNNSFDYNEFFTKKNSNVNGQPSVVYSAKIPSDFNEEIRLELLGTGALDGLDGTIHPAENLTTAINIVSCVAVVPKI